MSTTTASIAKRGCNATGITDELVEDGPQLPREDAGPEPTVADVLGAGEQYLPHEFTPDELDDTICNLCGARE